MPDTSVPDVTHESLVDVFGPLPTRYERGQWAPVGARKTQYRQLNRDYAPVVKLQLTANELETFTRHGLGDVVKFYSTKTPQVQGGNPKGEYYWFPREPGYHVHRADNALGLNMIIVNAQQHMLSERVFFTLDEVYPHPQLQAIWHEVFGITL